MQIFLHTAFSDSMCAYGSSASNGPAFQGVCQRNGTRPALWLAMSISLIELLHQHGYVSTFSCPISGHSTSLTGMIYVDDCDLLVFLPSSDLLDKAIAVVQKCPPLVRELTFYWWLFVSQEKFMGLTFIPAPWPPLVAT